MQAVLATLCCCGGGETSFLYEAIKCANYEQNPCVAECGNCCNGSEPPASIKFCDWYLQKIGITFPLQSGTCYVIEYRDCAYLLNIIPLGPCPGTPPAGVFNSGGLREIKSSGGQPCCPPSPPGGTCAPDLIVQGFPWADPWGIQTPVTISGNIQMCVFRPGTPSSAPGLCHRPGEFMADSYNTVTVDTTQQVGKCFETANPDVNLGTCSPTGRNDFLKLNELRLEEQFNPCTCLGSPGVAKYIRTFRKCYSAGECAEWYCPGFCSSSEDADYALCTANRADCTVIEDPVDSYELFTQYQIIKSSASYPCGNPGQPACECGYYSADAIRITFPLCYAVNAGYDPTSLDVGVQNAIKSLYIGKVEAYSACDSPCLANVGALYGGVQSVACIKFCGEFGYNVQVFSGSAGHIADRINAKMNPTISAASLNQYFWFGYRQGTNACGGPANQRPPYGPGDLLEVDRAVVDIANWKCYVYIRGYSPRFRYCVNQVVSGTVGAQLVGVSVCMSTNAVSPAEWAAGLRPSMAMVKNDCDTPGACPPGIICRSTGVTTATDCQPVGTYPQGNTLVGTLYTPGYVDTFGSPCGTGWLSSNCRRWACLDSGCSCSNCETGNCPDPCCNCGFGFPSTPCRNHTLQCSVPSNQLVSVT